jgi:transposase
MSKRELQRFHVLKLVLAGGLRRQEAAGLMNVSSHHAKRIKRRMEQEGV